MSSCPRCGNVVFGPGRTCVIHGDQADVGGRAPALESVKDSRRSRTLLALPVDPAPPPAPLLR